MFGGGGSGGGLGGGQTNRRYKKLYILIFDSTDPDRWILCVESYFKFYFLTEAEMLEAIVVAMEGDTLWWFQCENKRHPTHLGCTETGTGTYTGTGT